MKGRLPLLLMLLFCVLLLISCRNAGGGKYVGSRDAVEITKEELSAYTLIRSMRLSDAAGNEMSRMMQSIKRETGVQLYPTDDLFGIETVPPSPVYAVMMA